VIERLEALERAVIEAGHLILSYYGVDKDKGVEQKNDDSPVTLADRASDAYLREQLYRIEPLPILSEETQDDGARFTSARIWLVDPLDGTKDFIAGTDDFAINIALIEHGRPIFGLIYLPVHGTLYYAEKNAGAYSKELKRSTAPERLRTCDRPDHLHLLKSRFSDSQAHQALVTKHRHRIEKMSIVGSCIKGCRIAEGKAQGYYRFGLTSEWDTAPMDLIVHEAGGYLKQMDGQLIQYNRVDIINRQGFYVVSGILADLMNVTE